MLYSLLNDINIQHNLTVRILLYIKLEDTVMLIQGLNYNAQMHSGFLNEKGFIFCRV